MSASGRPAPTLRYFRGASEFRAWLEKSHGSTTRPSGYQRVSCFNTSGLRLMR